MNPHRIFYAALAIVLFAASVCAQIITGTITGQVTDASGAAIPNVEITARNTGTGISTRVQSDSSGTYVVPDLQAGAYEITVGHAGFRTSHLTGIALQSSQTVRVNASLQVGDVQQSVDVLAEAPLVNTESPTISSVINKKQMNDLPFAQQSIDGLIIMTPGAQTNYGESAPSTGGATHWGATNFTINGVQANDVGNGAAAYSYSLGLVSLPSLQSLQEFKVDSFNTAAEYRAVGTITMVTKAGTNAFHGEAYEFNENKSLNANTFLNNAKGISRSPFIRNQFGVNIGGPIVKNKAFFFYDYTGLRNRNYSSVNLTLPTAPMRTGDFSALCSSYSGGVCADTKGTQLYNPFTGAPFVNNIIPSNLITTQAQALLKYLPATTLAGATGLPNSAPNYYGLVSTAQDVNAMDVRLDYHISDKDNLYGVYTRNIGSPFQVALGYPSTYGNASDYGYKTFGYSLVETHTFSPTALNDFRASWFDHPNIRSGQNLDFNPQSLFPQLTASPNRGLPTMSIDGYTGMFRDAGRGYYGHAFDMEASDHFTLIKGRHTMKFGFETATYKTYGPNPNAPLGSFAFSGQWTGNKGQPGSPQSQGNAFADFLLGTANSSTTGTAGVFESVYHTWDTEFYAQDSWQISPKLTLSVGVRYMYQTPWLWQGDYSTYWDPGTNRLALPQDTATPTLPTYGASAAQFAAYNFTTTKALGIDKHYMIPDKNNWAPRVGFAFRPFNNERTVIRAGYGVYYNFNPAYVGSRDDVLSPPWLGGLGGVSSQTYSTQIPGKPSTSFLPDITFANPFPSNLATASGVSANPTIYSMQRDFKNAVSQQWNLTLEHQFSSNWSTRASYLGSQTHHLQWFFGDLNVPTVQKPNVSLQNQRPYQPWGSILATRSGAKQNFEQMQLEASKRYANGFSFQAEYQWTRSLDNADVSGGPQIPSSPQLDYGNSTNIRRHQLVFNYIYELPFGKGRRFASNIGKLGDGVIGGWQVSGITEYAGGVPFSVKFSVPSNYVGWWGGRADQVGSDLYAGRQTNSHDIVSGVQWFNTSAFAAPQPWQWGNGGRNIVFGPGLVNWDMSAQKYFTIREGIRLQVRADFLNAFNHFNLGAPSSTIADTRDGGTPITTSGKIYGGLSSGSPSRVIQVGAKLYF